MRGGVAVLLSTSLAVAGCDRLPGRGGEQRKQAAEAPAKAEPLAPGTTPMNERVAVIGILNKRNGIQRDIRMKPGQALRVDDLIIRLRACETTPPWEFDQLTGAFMQVDVQQPEGGFNRVFSGWLYKESPSLNVVENRVYDVWPKSCTMSFPAAPEQAGTLSDDSSPSSNVQSGRGGSRAERERLAEQPDVGLAWHFHRAQRGEVVGQELAVAQGEMADLEPRHQEGERDLRRVAGAAEHAFGEKGPAEHDAV